MIPAPLWLLAAALAGMPNISVGPMFGGQLAAGRIAPSFALDATWSPPIRLWAFWIGASARRRTGDEAREPWAFDLEVGTWYMVNVGLGGTAILTHDGRWVPAAHAFVDVPIPVVQPFLLEEDMILLLPYVRPSYRFEGGDDPWGWEAGVALKYAYVDILDDWLF